MVAAFENYLHEAFSEVLDRINSALPPCNFSKLPLEMAMRGRHGFPKLKNQRLSDIRVSAQRVLNNHIDGEAVADTRSNPNSDTVSTLFKSIGAKGILVKIKPSFDFAWGSRTAQTFVRDTLNNIVLRRHIVAHTASVLSISRSDIEDSRRFLQTLTGVLDVFLEKHVTKVISDAQ
jgi:hypothetical protein